MSDNNDIPLLALQQIDDEEVIIRPLTRRSRHLRLAIFLLLEIAYISLAIACYRKPIFIPVFLTLNQGKGLVTLSSIVWQTLAVFPVGSITIFVFSGEWSVQLLRSGRLVPGSTDKVSTLTATYFDKVVHFVAKSASTSFRLAFLASLALIGLTSLAPGTFFTSLLNLPTPIQVQIGNLASNTSVFNNELFAIDRPGIITRLEQIEKFPVGYDVQPNWIVGWPALDLPVNGAVQYPSDGVHFQYQCSWQAPVISYLDGVISDLTTADGTWVFWTYLGYQTPIAGLFSASAVLLPLTRFSNSSLSAFLFLGSNSTLREGTLVSPFDLSGIPTTYRPSGFMVSKATNTTFQYVPRLASVLVCDPKMNIFSVNVVRQTNLTLRILPTNNPSLVVGNIPDSTASQLFALSLVSATTPLQPFRNYDILVNFPAASLFMSNPTVSSDTASELDSLSTRPLDLSIINAKMDAYLLSASKAFAQGYLSSYGPGTTFNTLPVSGTVEVQRLALETNMPYFIVTVVLVSVTMVLLTLGGEEGVPFTLGSVLKEVQQGLDVIIDDGR